MADPASNTPAPKTSSPEYVWSTLRFIGKQLRLNQFLLKAAQRKKKEHEIVETEARQTIARLKRRIQWEIDTYPDAVKNMLPEEREELE